MGRVILGILAATILVVVLDKVFKKGGKEVELLRKDSFETKRYEFIDNRPRKVIPPRMDVPGDGIEKDNLLTVVRFNRENISI